MFDFNNLFKKVYAITDPTFDPHENYYTVLVNSAGRDSAYYLEYENHRRIHMGDSFYREIDTQTLDPAAFRTEIMSLERTFAIKVNTAFVFLYDLTQNALNTEYLQIVREHMQPNDTFAVIVLLPEDTEKRNAVFYEIGPEIRENEILYLYTKLQYRDRYLAEALCGTVLLHSSKKQYAELRRQEPVHMQKQNNALAGLPAEGAAAIQAKPAVFWSTLGCAFSNPKMDYLRSYVAAMCEKVQKLTSEDYASICGELYKGMVATANHAAVHALLADVVKRVPRVIKKEPNYEGYTLRDYFDQLYGRDGYRTIELSFKVTLSMMPNEMNENVIINVANTLFERASQYHSEDLYAEICAFLHEYRERMASKISANRASMVAMQGGNDSFQEDLDMYIDNYIKSYEMQKHSDFWDSVESYVLNNRSFFAPACRKARDLYLALEELKKELQFRRDVPVEREVVSSCSVTEILAVCENVRICSEIAETYKDPIRKNVGADDVDMTYLTTLSSPPGFSSELRYEMITGNGGYTAYVKQTIGKYLHFNMY